MTDELKQLAAEYQRRMSWLIDETTNWTLFLEDFGRDVQRQTVEAACRAECQYCRDYYGSAEVTPTPVFLERQYVPDNCGVIEGWVHARSWGGYWRCNADRIRRALLSPSQEEQVRKSMSERVKIVSHNGSWWIQEYGGLTQGPFTRRIAEDILSKIVQRGEPAAEPQPEKGWLKPILEQARADINARPARQKSRVAPAAPAPAAPLLSALDIAKKLVNVGDIDRREKILKQWVDSYIARWAAELEQVRKAFRNYLAGAISKRAAEAALGEKGKR